MDGARAGRGLLMRGRGRGIIEQGRIKGEADALEGRRMAFAMAETVAPVGG